MTRYGLGDLSGTDLEAVTGLLLDEPEWELDPDAPEVVLVRADTPHVGLPCPGLAIDAVADGTTLETALQLGATGYVGLDQGRYALLLAMRTVADGHAYIPPALLGGLLHNLVQANRPAQRVQDDRFDRLSRREREVLDLLAAGKDQVGIARALVISPQTARTHIQNVLVKLEVHSRLEAVALAVEHRQIGEGS